MDKGPGTAGCEVSLVRYPVSISLLSVALLAACEAAVKESAPPESLTARAIYHSTLCGGQPAAPLHRWITAEAAYHDMYRVFVSGQSDEHLASPPVVDFSSDAVLLISMGQRRTAGYKLELSPDRLTLRDGDLTVPVVWTQPEDGLFVAQMITHPCIIITLPRQDISFIRVEDQNGSVLLSGAKK